MENILEILEKNCKTDTKQLAVMVGKTEEEIIAVIERCQKENIIIGYNALINWEKTSKDSVLAFIEVKVTPQRVEGFDRIAQRIYKFKEVKSCYLMSGGFDLAVIVEGTSIKDVALFISGKLATIESVQSTATHFVLKKYKDKSIIFEENNTDGREAVVL